MTNHKVRPTAKTRFQRITMRLLTPLLLAGALFVGPAVFETAPVAHAATDCKARVIQPPTRANGGVRAEGVVECNGRVGEIDATGILFRGNERVDDDFCGAPLAKQCHVTPFVPDTSGRVQGPSTEWCLVIQGAYTPWDKTFEYVDDVKACTVL